MSYLEKCGWCGSIKITANLGPYGFRVSCHSCAYVGDLDDLLEPVRRAPLAERGGKAAGVSSLRGTTAAGEE